MNGEEPQRGRAMNGSLTKTPGVSSYDGLVRQSIQNQAEGSGVYIQVLSLQLREQLILEGLGKHLCGE